MAFYLRIWRILILCSTTDFTCNFEYEEKSIQVVVATHRFQPIWRSVLDLSWAQLMLETMLTTVSIKERIQWHQLGNCYSRVGSNGEAEISACNSIYRFTRTWATYAVCLCRVLNNEPSKSAKCTPTSARSMSFHKNRQGHIIEKILGILAIPPLTAVSSNFGIPS